MRKLLIRTAAALCILASIIFPAAADERITNFDVSAALEKDASLLITERITVNAENKAIRRGITRSFPVKERVDGYGLRRYTFDVVSVKCDGRDAQFKKDVNGYMAGMAIGNPKEYISKGSHTYEIVYRTKGHVRFLADKDEIYFNAIGPDNQFPIDKASFTLTLPDGAKPLTVKAWTGKTGETGSDYAADGVTLRTTRTLEPGEAFTVAEGWKKGLVAEPSAGLSGWIGMHRAPVLLGLLVLLIVYLAGAWFFLYRKGTSGTVIPLFHAPDGVDPGLAAWMMSDRDIADEALMFQSDMLWLAVNGWATMDMRDPKNIILKSAKPASPKKGWVSSACSDMHDLFFGKADEIDFSKKGSKAGSLVYAYDSVMEKYDGKNITKGDGTEEFQTGLTDSLYKVSFLPGLIGLLVSLGIFWWLLGRIAQPGLDHNYSSFTMIWYPGLLFLVISLIWTLVPILLRGEKRGMRIGVFTAAAIVTAIIAAFLVFILLDADWLFIVVFLLIILLPCLFTARFNIQLTSEGKKLQNDLRGLKMYMETAEKDRLAIINAPDDTVAKYEEILPYAVALGCGEAWQDRFDPLLDGVDYVPAWTEYDENEQLVREEKYRRELLRRAAADAAAANSAASAIRRAAERSEHAKAKSSSGSSSSSSSGGSAGSGSGGGGVGGW